MTILQAILLGIFTGSLTTTGIILGAQMKSDRLQAIQLAQDNALKEMALISARPQRAYSQHNTPNPKATFRTVPIHTCRA